MNKIKMIDLLNMLASGDINLPTKVKFKNPDREMFILGNAFWWENIDGTCNEAYGALNQDKLNDYVEIIKDAPILTDKEKEYLSAVIKPFRDKVEFVQKYIENPYTEESHIFILIKSGGVLIFPSFDANAMYKEMKKDKKYTLEELGL